MTLADAFRSTLAAVAGPVGADDLTRYRTDPVAYARERLGVIFQPWQACLAYAIAGLWQKITPEMSALAQMKNPGQRKIAVRSGQKTGKTKLLVCIALWFFECFDGARAPMTAAIADQIRAVLWRELFVTLNAAPHRPPEKPSEDPSRGMLSKDRTREIRGFTGRDVEALAGISGNLLYLIDEASHLEQKKAEAIEGNTAGEGDLGAPIVYTSQPTRAEGPFADAFHSAAEFWTTMVFDAEVIAEYQQKRGLKIPGMATLARIRRWKDEYGEDSPFYQVRVKGNFLRNETGKIIPLHYIIAAQERWKEAPEAGRLQIGIDCAGEGERGDEWAWSLVRGKKQVAKFEKHGLTKEDALVHTTGLVQTHRMGDETPVVVIDNEGPIGWEFWKMAAALGDKLTKESPPQAFEVYGVKASQKARRRPDLYDRRRDEIWANLAAWLKDDESAIVPDTKLEADLHCPDWRSDVNGKLKATPKDEMKERLRGRSPDRADALALSVWQPTQWVDEADAAQGIQPPADRAPEHAPAFDPLAPPMGDPYALLSGSMPSR